MGDNGNHPLDELALEESRRQSALGARQWMISLEEYMRVGFSREEAMRMLVAFAGRPPGMTAEDTERLFGQLIQSMKEGMG